MTRHAKDILLAIVGLLAACGLGALLLAAGCQHTQHLPETRPAAILGEPTPDALIWSADIAKSRRAWLAEAEKRFGSGRVYLFFCHGGNSKGRWICGPLRIGGESFDMESVARVLSDEHAAQIVVLISCNPGGYSLHDPRKNVFYARRNVWAEPHDPCAMLFNCANSIGEFTNQ
jgi:hypothetical protein